MLTEHESKAARALKDGKAWLERCKETTMYEGHPAVVINRLVEALEGSRLSPPPGEGKELVEAATDVLAERRRQIEVEGRTAEHDDTNEAGRFRKKPVVIDAWQLDAARTAEAPDWLKAAYAADTMRPQIGEVLIEGPRGGPLFMTIKTLEGDMQADAGDWIIRGVKGELYPCKPDIFALTYEPTAPTPPADQDIEKAAYMRGWNDREDGILERAERIRPPAIEAEELAKLREDLRLLMLRQPVPCDRTTYGEGLANGLSMAIEHIDRIKPSARLPVAAGGGEEHELSMREIAALRADLDAAREREAGLREALRDLFDMGDSHDAGAWNWESGAAMEKARALLSDQPVEGEG